VNPDGMLIGEHSTKHDFSVLPGHGRIYDNMESMSIQFTQPSYSTWMNNRILIAMMIFWVSTPQDSSSSNEDYFHLWFNFLGWQVH